MTADLAGPIRNGGIGTAYAYLADFLNDHGHQVTILYASGRHVEAGAIDEWVAEYATRGIRVVLLPKPEVAQSPGFLGRVSEKQYAVYEWLKHEEFDLVHASEWRGLCYFAMAARQCGVGFADTRFCIKCSSPTLWSRTGGFAQLGGMGELATSYFEQRSVELADFVVSGSVHMLDWMVAHGYELPPNSFQQPNIMLPEAEAESVDGDRLPRPVDEVVFFGRLEPRKGIHLFLAAIDQLAQAGAMPSRVTFLGKEHRQFDLAAELATRTWGDSATVISDFGQREAVDYLRGGARLAVIPSLLENSSFAIYECLFHGIDFVASDVGGNPELVHEADRSRTLFRPTPAALAEQVQARLGGSRPSRSSFDNAQNLEVWAAFHRSLGGIDDRHGALASPTAPLVSVCIVHHERPEMLLQAVESAIGQTHPSIEVVVIDDGSVSTGATRLLEQLPDRYRGHDIKVERQPNSYPGAARNRAVRLASGDFVLFLDDDNLLKPRAIETYLGALERSGAECVVSFGDQFESMSDIEADVPISRLTPWGADTATGLFRNVFGDTNMLISRELAASTRFSEAYRVGKEDQDFLARLALSGVKVALIPEPLYWYRRQDNVERIRARHLGDEAGRSLVSQGYIASGVAPPRMIAAAAMLFEHVEQKNQRIARLEQRLSEERAAKNRAWELYEKLKGGN